MRKGGKNGAVLRQNLLNAFDFSLFVNAKANRTAFCKSVLFAVLFCIIKKRLSQALLNWYKLKGTS